VSLRVWTSSPLLYTISCSNTWWSWVPGNVTPETLAHKPVPVSRPPCWEAHIVMYHNICFLLLPTGTDYFKNLFISYILWTFLIYCDVSQYMGGNELLEIIRSSWQQRCKCCISNIDPITRRLISGSHLLYSSSILDVPNYSLLCRPKYSRNDYFEDLRVCYVWRSKSLLCLKI